MAELVLSKDVLSIVKTLALNVSLNIPIKTEYASLKTVQIGKMINATPAKAVINQKMVFVLKNNHMYALIEADLIISK